MFPIIKKPVNWFALQVNWLVSIWWETLVVNELKDKFMILLDIYTYENIYANVQSQPQKQ